MGRRANASGLLLVVLDLLEVGIDDLVAGAGLGSTARPSGIGLWGASGLGLGTIDRLADLQRCLRKRLRRRLDSVDIGALGSLARRGNRSLDLSLHRSRDFLAILLQRLLGRVGKGLQVVPDLHLLAPLLILAGVLF